MINPEWTVSIEAIDPEKAGNLLRFNSKNRNVKDSRIRQYSEDMKGDDWMFNGQSIVFDKNGELVDGQHRLKAIIVSQRTLPFVVVRGVTPMSNVTLDTGATRSLKDSLTILQEKNAGATANVVTSYANVKNGKYKEAKAGGAIETVKRLTELFLSKPEYFRALTLLAYRELAKAPVRIVSISQYVTILMIISGGEYNHHHVDFMRFLIGSKNADGSAASWLCKTLVKSKTRKEILNRKWVNAVAVKAWNSYINGNPAVSYMQYKMDSPFPKVEKLQTIKEEVLEAV